MKNTKIMMFTLFIIATCLNSSLYCGRGSGAGYFAAGALTGAAVTGIAVSASRPRYEESYSSDTRNLKQCKRALRKVENENEQLYDQIDAQQEEIDELQQEIDDLKGESKVTKRMTSSRR
jgi:peptidoglycan hydrolase CwlO-like protein